MTSITLLSPAGSPFPPTISATSGLAWLTLGGDIGHLLRPHGPERDSLHEVALVLPDGSFATASAGNRLELFAAFLAGDDVGVVTSYLFRADRL